MIRIDEIWLSTQPMDMRAGMDTTMAQVVRAFVCPAAGTGQISLGSSSPR